MRNHECPVEPLRRLDSTSPCHRALPYCRWMRFPLLSALTLSGGFDLPLTSCAAARSYHLALGELTPMVNFLACLLGRATAFFRFLHLRCIGVDGHLRLLPSLAFTPWYASCWQTFSSCPLSLPIFLFTDISRVGSPAEKC